jgi:hypothetical protein
MAEGIEIFDLNREWTRIDTNKNLNRRWTQIYADKDNSIDSIQVGGALHSAFATKADVDARNCL